MRKHFKNTYIGFFCWIAATLLGCLAFNLRIGIIISFSYLLIGLVHYLTPLFRVKNLKVSILFSFLFFLKQIITLWVLISKLLPQNDRTHGQSIAQ